MNKPKTLIPPPLPYVAAIAGGWWLDRHVAAISLSSGSVHQAFALILIFSGFGLMLWAIWQLHRHQTTFNPYSAARKLCTSGPFRFSRNPIYLGDWLILAGFSLWLMTLWPLLFSPVVWLFIRYGVIRHEEAHLEARFGEDFRQYKQQVRRWI